MKRNVNMTLVRQVDSSGNYFYTATGGELEQTIRGIAQLTAQIAAGAGRAFGGPGIAAPQVTVRQAAVTITPLDGDELRVVVNSDAIIQVAGSQQRFQREQAGIARRASAPPAR